MGHYLGITMSFFIRNEIMMYFHCKAGEILMVDPVAKFKTKNPDYP